MSKQQYLRALNREIQKLNGIIDNKILHDYDYKRESRRHRELLRQLRKIERRRAWRTLLTPSFLSRA